MSFSCDLHSTVGKMPPLYLFPSPALFLLCEAPSPPHHSVAKNPHALSMFKEPPSKARQYVKARKDPIKSREPERPVEVNLFGGAFSRSSWSGLPPSTSCMQPIGLQGSGWQDWGNQFHPAFAQGIGLSCVSSTPYVTCMYMVVFVMKQVTEQEANTCTPTCTNNHSR